jgi:hypothetical protein
MKPFTPHLGDLTLLARYWPQIFGRALNPESILEGLHAPRAQSGRSDHLDDHTPEMRRALRGLATLERLGRNGHRREASILAYCHVVCGPVALTSGEAYVAIASHYSKSKKPVTPSRRQKLLEQGLRLYTAALKVWEVQR